jgi:hypothetical protein
MLGRPAPLTRRALPLGCLALLLAASEVRAHRLVAEYQVLPGHKVQVEARYRVIPRSIPAQQARVRIFRPNGQVLVEGRTDEEGMFLFSYVEMEPLQVEVTQAGHRDAFRIPASKLGAIPGDEGQAPTAKSSGEPGASAADLGAREWVKEVLIGVGFVLALAAFVLSLRNARQLRELKNHSGPPK